MTSRWTVAAAGTALMACLGAVYSWSLFTQPLVAAFGWSTTTTTWAFALCIFFLGVGAIAGGRWQDRRGPRRVALAGAILWGLANVLAGVGTARLGAPWLYLTYGVLGGLGLGLGYVTPVAAVTKWFPDRRGLGGGMVVMGFGLGAFLYNLVLRAIPSFGAAAAEAAAVVAARAAGAEAALGAEGVRAIMATFVVSGIAFAAIGGLCAAVLRDPRASDLPDPAREAAARAAAAPDGAAAADQPPSRALRTPQFWALWAMLFLNVTAGILFISNAVPIMRELTGAAPDTAAAVYGLVALANGLGRFFWGAVSDRIGRNLAYVLIYGSQVVIFFVVGRFESLPVVAALFAVVLLGYGGGFGTMPSFVADYFGTRHMGANYGWILTAWGLGGVAGPIFVAAVKDATGTFAGALPVIAAILLAALVLPLVTRRPGERRRPFHRGLLRPG